MNSAMLLFHIMLSVTIAIPTSEIVSLVLTMTFCIYLVS